jgi:transcriptional regulator with XRE-family HTH domain
MTAVNELLDNVKIRLNLASDMALAERLTVTRSLVSRWRKGDTPLADERIAQICALAKLDGPTWIAMIHAERATSATERALWRLMLDRMSAAAAVVALVALSMPGLANAKTAQIQAVSAADNGGMYIMLRVRSTLGRPKARDTTASLWPGLPAISPCQRSQSLPTPPVVKRNPQDLPIITRPRDACLQ